MEDIMTIIEMLVATGCVCFAALFIGAVYKVVKK
jgi:hypothetical protein